MSKFRPPRRAWKVAAAFWMLVAAVPLTLAPAFAADFGSAADVHDFYRTAASDCEPDSVACLKPHDATVVHDFAIAELEDSDRQTVYRKRDNRWHILAFSRGDGFDATELIEQHVPRAIATALVAHNASARRAALPMRPERDCIHTAVKLAATYFAHEPGSGRVIFLFGRIHDPYQGTLGAILVNRGVPDLSHVRYGDRVQLCLVNVPVPQGRCKPTIDRRGRVYRMFDYRLLQAYTSGNANHGCGGA